MGQSNGYFTISDLAKELDVKKNHIRFCEENGLIPPRVSKLKRRVYSRYDRERLKFVFHFVLLGYSKEQIIDLIGTPDTNLDENDQLLQGIEYGLKEIKKLEKRKEELSFTKQTRTINEIEMLREYIKKIKIIKSGVLEEPLAESSIRFEEKEKIHAKPVTSITTGAAEKTTQHPVKVISFFIAGLALVILIGSYFYYQAGQKEPVHSEKTRVLQAPVPMDQITKTQAEVQRTGKLVQSSSETQQGSLKVTSTKSSSDSTQTAEITPVVSEVALAPEKDKPDSLEVKEVPKDAAQKEVAGEDLLEKAAPTVAGEDTLTAAEPEAVKEKVADIEIQGVPESASAITGSPVASDVTLLPEKEKPDNLKVEEVQKDVVPEEVTEEALSEKAAPAVAGENTLTTAMSDPESERAPNIEVKEAPDSESAEKASLPKDHVSLVSEKQKPIITKVEGTPKDGTEQEIETEGLKEKEMPDAAGEEALMAAKPEFGEEKVAEIDNEPSLTEPEKEVKQITTEEGLTQQQNELSRLKAFLSEYCQAYSNKDLDKFITFFTSDATENNRPFHELLPSYRKNLETMESLTYRIELTSFSKQTASENIMVRGRFFTRYQVQKGVLKEDNGSIFMELLKNGDSFLVKQLNY